MYKLQTAKKIELKQDFFGKAPNIFVGRYGYPNIRVGILGTQEYNKHDDPLAWSKEGTTIPEIIKLRSELINSNFQSGIKSFGDKLTDLSKDLSLGKRPTDVEINLEKKPAFRITFNTHEQPHGPSVALKQARVTEDIKVDTRIDKATSATDLLAADAVSDLSRKGIDEHYLTKVFSMGNFGLPTERKLVPTRWSITAVDDIIGKRKIEELKKCNVSDIKVYTGGYFGNNYIIILFDEVWQYELFEQFVPSTRDPASPVLVETDHESYDGRKSYVEETAGGYYAARIGIIERLLHERRQASVLAIRVITEEYTAPLGVWVVREAVRKTMETRPITFASRELAVNFAKQYCKRHFNYDITSVLSKSILLKSISGQTKLGSF